MTESIHTNPILESLSLGQQFKKAREALNLSIEEVAQKTTIKKNHIESLENDIFILPNVSPTFVRGYVRNYLRFLRLPSELASNVNYGEVTIPKEVVHKTSTETVVQKSQNQWVKYLSFVVLLGTVGMTLLWWWQDYQKEQENRDQFVSNSIPVEIAPKTQANQVALQNTAQNQPLATESTVATVATEAENTTTTTATTTTTVAPSEVATETAPANETSNVLLAENRAETNDAESQTTAVGNDELRIEITGKESWITVKSPTSKRSLAEKLYTTGEVLTFNGNEQYRLTIGAPANVKLYYKGELVPLKIDGRVARIRLPLAQ